MAAMLYRMVSRLNETSWSLMRIFTVSSTKSRRTADHVGQDLLCKGIRDSGKIRKGTVVRQIGNIRQQLDPWTVAFELTLR